MEKIQCSFCNIFISKDKLLHHLNKAHQNIIPLEKDRQKYHYDIQFGKKTIISIIDSYVGGMSLPELKTKFNIGYSATQKILRAHDIYIRSSSEAMNSSIRKEKFANTCISKYGVQNISQLDSIKEQKKQTFIKHYGVDNIWKDPEYYIWLHKYMLETYGVKSLPNRFGNKKVIRISKTEKYVQSILEEMKLRYISQFFIGRKNFDFLLVDHNLIIEVNGDYWHANPAIYKETDVLNFPNNKKIVAGALWHKDKEKRNLAEERGYGIMYLWETLINSKDKILIRNLILEKINGNKIL